MKRETPRLRQASPKTRVPADQHGLPFASKAAVGRPASNVEPVIFTATETLLQRKSLGELTVADILAEADVSRTTFYKYFSSKAMVVSAMLLACQDELLGVMRPWSTRRGRPPAEALREALDAAAKVWARHRPVLRASSESWHSEPEIGQQWVATMDYFVDDISRQITKERKAGVAPDGVDSLQIARHLAWGGERLLYLAGFGMFGPGMESDVVDSMVAIWAGAIYRI